VQKTPKYQGKRGRAKCPASGVCSLIWL